jgi:hypothetical protein
MLVDVFTTKAPAAFANAEEEMEPDETATMFTLAEHVMLKFPKDTDAAAAVVAAPTVAEQDTLTEAEPEITRSTDDVTDADALADADASIILSALALTDAMQSAGPVTPYRLVP